MTNSDPVTPFARICPKELTWQAQSDENISKMFSVVLFMILKNWKESKWLSVRDDFNNTGVHSYNGMLCSH